MRRAGTAAVLGLFALVTGCTATPAAPAAAPPPAPTTAGAPTTGAPSPSTGTPAAARPSPTGPGCPAPGPEPSDPTALRPLAASYLAAAVAVDISPRCQVVLGGRADGTPSGPVTMVDAGGSGAVLRLDATGRRVLGTTRLAGGVSDLEVRREGGDIAVATDRAVTVLDPDGGRVRWRRTGAVSRVAIGAAGTVAALGSGAVRVYAADGTLSATVRPAGRTVEDVAVDDRAGLVFVGGYRQAGGPCRTVQIPFLYAYDRRGGLRWRAYDQPADRLGDLCADSRVDRVALGRDGRLYLAGSTDGGNSVFSRAAQSPDRPAPNVVIDRFSQSSNLSGAARHTYLARLDASTGRHLAGQLVLTRLPSKGDRGNTIRPGAVTADEHGRVYAGGVAAAFVADRDRLTMNGRRLRAYAGGDAWTMVLSPDLRRRITWTVWTDGGAGGVTGLAAGGGLAAVAAQVDRPGFYLVGAVRSRPGGGYLAVWPGLP